MASRNLSLPAVVTLPEASDDLLEGAALLICALRPPCMATAIPQLERLLPRDADRAALLHDLLTGSASEAGRRGLERLRQDAHLGLTPTVIEQQEAETAAAILANLLERMEAQRAARAELVRAEAEIQGEADEGLTWRISQITRARHRAERPDMENLGDFSEDREALSAQLSDWLSGQIWRKPPRR